MTHEPECPTGKDWYEMCECETLRSAYRRGREDAAEAVAHVRIYGVTTMRLASFRADAIIAAEGAAARGDGEQE